MALHARLMLGRLPPLRAASTSLRIPTTSIHRSRAFSTFHALKAASPVATQPGSSDLREVGQNAKEEGRKIFRDVASAISGANPSASTSQTGAAGGIEELEHQVESLTGLAQTVPKEAWMYGGAGFLPYAGTSLATIYLARQAYLAEKAGVDSTIDLDTAIALLHHVELIQISYGAVILSFLGALHWGFEFAGYGGRKGTPRYLMGMMPVLLGWPSLLLPAQMALAGQWAAFTAVWYLDSRATARGWTPKWYSTYRFGLTAVVGTSIVVTMGATGYYATGSTGTAAEKLARIKAAPQVKAKNTEAAGGPRIEGTVSGDMSTTSGMDAYVVFENEEKKREAEEKRKEEEAEEKAKEAKEAAEEKRDAAYKKAQSARDNAEGRE